MKCGVCKRDGRKVYRRGTTDMLPGEKFIWRSTNNKPVCGKCLNIALEKMKVLDEKEPTPPTNTELADWCEEAKDDIPPDTEGTRETRLRLELIAARLRESEGK